MVFISNMTGPKKMNRRKSIYLVKLMITDGEKLNLIEVFYKKKKRKKE